MAGSALKSEPQGSLIAGRYEVLGLISAQTPVYLASDEAQRQTLRSLQVLIAIKAYDRINTAQQSWLENEIVLSQRFRHPNLIDLYDVVIDGHVAFLTMEYVRGVTLEFCITDLFFSTEQIYSITTQMLRALVQWHALGFTQGNITAADFILREDGRVKFLCWGKRPNASTRPELDVAAVCKIASSLFKRETKFLEPRGAGRFRAALQALFETAAQGETSASDLLARVENSWSFSNTEENPQQVSVVLDEAIEQTNTILTNRGITALLLFTLFFLVYLILIAIFGEAVCIGIVGPRISNLTG